MPGLPATRGARVPGRCKLACPGEIRLGPVTAGVAVDIGLISDIHAYADPLREALSIFRERQVDAIICAGDIAGYGGDDLDQGIELLVEHECLMVAGNHDHVHDCPQHDVIYRRTGFFDALPPMLDLDLAGRRVYVVHASPPDLQHGGIRLLDEKGNIVPSQAVYWARELESLGRDVLIVGHTHQVFAEQLGDVLVINPGSTCFNHTCMVLSLPGMLVQTYSLSGRRPVMSWNWGRYFGRSMGRGPR